jgi:hypothetical protein
MTTIYNLIDFNCNKKYLFILVKLLATFSEYLQQLSMCLAGGPSLLVNVESGLLIHINIIGDRLLQVRHILAQLHLHPRLG